VAEKERVKQAESKTYGPGKYNEPLEKLHGDAGFIGKHDGKTQYYNKDGKPRAPKEGEIGYESRKDRFRRVVNRRVPAALKAIGYVTNLARGSGYEYTPEQAEKVIKTFQEAVAVLANAFRGTKAARDMWSV